MNTTITEKEEKGKSGVTLMNIIDEGKYQTDELSMLIARLRHIEEALSGSTPDTTENIEDNNNTMIDTLHSINARKLLKIQEISRLLGSIESSLGI